MKKIIKISSLFALLLMPSIIVSQVHNKLPQFQKIHDTHIATLETKCSATCEILIIKRKCFEEIFESSPEKNTLLYKELSFLSDNSYLQCANEKALN